MADSNKIAETLLSCLSDDEAAAKPAAVALASLVITALVEQAEAMKSIAVSLEKLANPPVQTIAAGTLDPNTLGGGHV